MLRSLMCAAVACVAAGIACLAATGVTMAQSTPEFKLGFKALADQIPDVVGVPLENEHWGDNGDSLQQTSTGLMVWRKADNWTAFTNGSVTWINGPRGVQSRLNSQRFEWEQEAPPSVPPAAPAPSPGLILYRADWSGGMGAWPSTGGWTVLNGMLVDDGSTQSLVLLAPYQPEQVANYAVEAEIQVVSMGQYRRFGVVARDSFVGGIDSWSFRNLRSALVGTASEALAQKEFDPGDRWHIYRLEVAGNRLRLLIDGTLMCEAIDNRYLSPGKVGIYNSGVQLNVRSFKVIAL